MVFTGTKDDLKKDGSIEDRFYALADAGARGGTKAKPQQKEVA